MKPARTALSVTLALALAACGGGGGSSSPPTSADPTPTPTGSPTPSPTPTACSVADQIAYADEVLDEWYLFPDLLDNSVNPAAFTDVQDYLDARIAPARAQGIDRGFTFATVASDEDAVISTGANAGFGVQLVYDVSGNRVFVLEAYENAPALSAGIDRGTELIAIGTSAANLQLVSSLMATGGPQAVVNALGPSDPGVTRVLRIRTLQGATIDRTVTKTEFALDPISDRYGVRIFNEGSRKVGYVNLRTFFIASAATELEDAFDQFRQEGVTELIIDLRYNGGGLVAVADTLGDLLGRNRVGQVWSRTLWRPSKSGRNSTEPFEFEEEAIQPTKIAFIGFNGTASASELVMNSTVPYLGSNVALVGRNTFGKPVGQSGFDLPDCDLRIRATTFRTVNANDEGDYYTGLASTMPNTCFAFDDISIPLGDPREDSIATALDFLAGRSCTPISASANRGIGAASADGGKGDPGATRRLLQPARPNPVQRQIPGVF